MKLGAKAFSGNNTLKKTALLVSGMLSGIIGSYLLAVPCYVLFMLLGIYKGKHIVFDEFFPVPLIAVFFIGVALYVYAARVFFWLFPGYEKAYASERKSTFSEKINRAIEHRNEKSYKEKRSKMERRIYWLRHELSEVLTNVPDDPYVMALCVSEGLGMGIVKIDSNQYSFSRSNLEDKAFLKDWKERAEKDKETVTDIVDIWMSALHGARIEYRVDKEPLITIGKNLGVEAMLKAYAAGVSIEHIVAK